MDARWYNVMCKAKSEIRTLYGNVEWNPGPENRQKRVGRGLTNPTLQRLRKKKAYPPKEEEVLYEWVRVSDCCLTPTQQFFSYIMARTS
jgi:hypothetical protein